MNGIEIDFSFNISNFTPRQAVQNFAVHMVTGPVGMSVATPLSISCTFVIIWVSNRPPKDLADWFCCNRNNQEASLTCYVSVLYHRTHFQESR